MADPGHVFIIGKVWPEPGSSAAGSRMLQLIRAFLDQGWRISFGTAANESEYMADLGSLGVKTYGIELNKENFDIFIKTLNPDIVVFDRFTTEEQFGWRVAEHCPQALRVLDTEDLHCLRAARHKALKEKRDFELKDLLSETARREIASIYRCDLSLIISEFEMQLLSGFFKVDQPLLHYIPFLTGPLSMERTKAWPAFSERSGFVSIGNFLHEPNWDAVLFLKQEVWPLIRKQLPKAELHVYGAYPSHKVFELHSPKEGFLIRGRAERAETVLSGARICLAPLRFGAGLKGKLADAMLCGTPSVTTSIGAEAMHGTLAWNGIIAGSAEEIAHAAVKLYSDEIAWKQAQQNGIRIIAEIFSKVRHENALITKLLFIQDRLKEHREENFTGSMLLQHTALSSRYMALWIEAKNKIRENETE